VYYLYCNINQVTCKSNVNAMDMCAI